MISLLSALGQFSVPNFKVEGGSKKNECLGGLKSSCHRYLPGGLLCSLCPKRCGKVKYGFEDSIFNVDIAQFYRNNQLMFCDILVLLND